MRLFSHSQSTYWGKLRRLKFWWVGVTLDWDFHRWILGPHDGSALSDGIPASPSSGKES